jgi:hypothetical protein
MIKYCLGRVKKKSFSEKEGLQKFDSLNVIHLKMKPLMRKLFWIMDGSKARIGRKSISGSVSVPGPSGGPSVGKRVLLKKHFDRVYGESSGSVPNRLSPAIPWNMSLAAKCS